MQCFMPSLPTHGNIQQWYMQYKKSHYFTKLTAIQHIPDQNIVSVTFFVWRFRKIGIQLGPWVREGQNFMEAFLKLE